ncbi:UvrD-helicase domain-containing protein [Catellatospora sp. KI3]|uniref:UvrD-helicase domain-containing protein n=1 Tax=Catellatospora sp. KI3 TaxID=3041620 RepID=UPI002482B8EA|nr:UvrD-helicase domain-containing protein [Catellatospora sp. KI3]MDI1461713.1 UvrD-helicase domain-containing protein [Catellatospora sp. KI3]
MSGFRVPPVWTADLHIHSRYSRACSKDLELPVLAWWARRKGIALLGTGDVTHPAWFEHLRTHLREAEPGLYRLNAETERDVAQKLPPRLASGEPARFMLSVEISTIYKRGDRTRKVHHLIYLPDLDAAQRFRERLGRVGNLASDGRPILGLDSRDLLEITLEASPDAYLVPAHIWTPWFSALGSKSGFDAIADCYADLAGHITAVETGLSSDPAMNHRVSSLDAYTLVSNSDAHSPQALAREATRFDCALDYYAVKNALAGGPGMAGTIEFFPEEGKYHGDGHRDCGVNWTPAQSRETGGLCPVCSRPLTIGVLARVEALADRAEGVAPANAKPVTHLVQLPELVGEIEGVGPKTRTVEGRVNALVAALGPELSILTEVPLDEVAAVGGELLGESVRRLRAGAVHRVPGYDGEYGVIRLFEPDELRPLSAAPDTLFDLPVAAVPAPRKPKAAAPAKPVVRRTTPRRPVSAPPLPPEPSPHEPFEPMLAGMEEVGTGLLDRLDAMQRVAASAPGGPLLIVAGPGTGKTRTLTHRLAYLCAEMNVYPEECLAITFTRRAADELRHRLAGLLGPVADDVTVSTFHALALAVLREQEPNLMVVDEPGCPDGILLDELVPRLVALLRAQPSLVDKLRARWPWVFVDEYQDVDPDQYALLRLLVPSDGNLCAIGDPDQAIYSFRGADVSFFMDFSRDFVDARVVRLTRNYRSAAPILAAAVQAIAPTSLVPGRRLDPARVDPDAPLIGRYAADSPADEAGFIARKVDELVGGVSHRTRADTRGMTGATVSFNDIAVLYRTDAQAAVIVDVLSRAGVPVQKRSHDRLRDRAGVNALVAEMRLATGLNGSVAARLTLTAKVLIERPALGRATPEPDEVWSAVDLLMPLAQRCGADLGRFLADVTTGAEVDALDPRAEAVTLLTLHAAKGLEFPVVFLAGCEDGLLPLRMPGSTPTEADVAEERRLFFVGLTRAQRRLYVSHSARRARFGSERDCRPTPFLQSIDPGLLEQLNEQGPRRPRDQQLRLI